MEECLFRAVPLALGALIGARFGRRRLGIARRVRAPGAGLRRGTRQLPGLSRVLATGRARRAFDALGGDLPALRLAADDPAARALRLGAVRDPAVPGRCARSVGAAGARFRGGARASRRRAVAARARRRDGANCRNRCATAHGCRRRRWRRRARVAALASSPRASRSSSSARCPSSGSRALPRGSRSRRSEADVPPLEIRSRGGRSARPTRHSQARGVTLGPEWRRFSTVRVASDEGQWTQHRFVWREAGPEAYRALVGNDARAAGVGSALRDVRRRRRVAGRGMASDDRARRQGAPGSAPAARGASPGRACRRRRPSRARKSICARASAWIPRALTLVAADRRIVRRAPIGRSCSPIPASTSARTARRASR